MACLQNKNRSEFSLSKSIHSLAYVVAFDRPPTEYKLSNYNPTTLTIAFRCRSEKHIIQSIDMGCFGSKDKLSKEDMDFLKSHTRYDESTIKEWYKGFKVSFVHRNSVTYPRLNNCQRLKFWKPKTLIFTATVR